ncbi:MAG TPA: ribosome maturation factor RimP [Gammaproteobacteria bacterium]|nr:ribosome maturation factor RimP [Gammaproteobacteria bacterium]
MRQAAEHLYELLTPAVTALGYELVGVEHIMQGKHSVLRVYIDAEDGVTVDDCARASHQISGVLDIEDPIRGEYSLEVSSPGLDRPLFTLAHFERFAGQLARLVLNTPWQGRRKLTGRLGGVREQKVVLDVDGEEALLTLQEIDKARLVPEL